MSNFLLLLFGIFVGGGIAIWAIRDEMRKRREFAERLRRYGKPK